MSIFNHFNGLSQLLAFSATGYKQVFWLGPPMLPQFTPTLIPHCNPHKFHTIHRDVDCSIIQLEFDTYRTQGAEFFLASPFLLQPIFLLARVQISLLNNSMHPLDSTTMPFYTPLLQRAQIATLFFQCILIL